MAEPGICDLCQEDFNEDSRCPRILPCSHHFCTSCIQKLLVKRMKSCPVCRQDFVATSVKDFMVNRGVLDFIRYLKSQDGPKPNTSVTSGMYSKDAKLTNRSEQNAVHSFDSGQRCNNDNHNNNNRSQDSQNDGRQSAFDEWFDANDYADQQTDESTDDERDIDWDQGNEDLVDFDAHDDAWDQANEENEGNFDDDDDWGEADHQENVDDYDWDRADDEQGDFENEEDSGQGDEEHEEINNEWEEANDGNEGDMDDNWGQADEGHEDYENDDWAEANDGPEDLDNDVWDQVVDEQEDGSIYNWDCDETDEFVDVEGFEPDDGNHGDYDDGNDNAFEEDYYFEENNDCRESDNDSDY